MNTLVHVKDANEANPWFVEDHRMSYPLASLALSVNRILRQQPTASCQGGVIHSTVDIVPDKI